MKLNKLISTLISAIIAFSALCIQTYASENCTEAARQTYALLCASKIMDYDENFDYTKAVGKKEFCDIYYAYFNTEPESIPENIKNCTAVDMLALRCDSEAVGKHPISFFKDYGLVDAKYREAYKTMCRNGYLNFKNEFLKPSDSLRYCEYLHMLSFFKNDFSRTQNLELTSGTVTDSSSQNNIITISVSSGSKIIDFKFRRGDEFIVYKDFVITPYNYNIKRGDNAEFYTKSGKIIYVSIKSPNESLNDDNINTNNLNIFKSTIYLCDTPNNQIILKNPLTRDYHVFGIDAHTLIYNKDEKKFVSDINNLFLDIECNFIVDAEKNEVKYIYIE